jgi:hypothetical protein
MYCQVRHLIFEGAIVERTVLGARSARGRNVARDVFEVKPVSGSRAGFPVVRALTDGGVVMIWRVTASLAVLERRKSVIVVTIHPRAWMVSASPGG